MNNLKQSMKTFKWSWLCSLTGFGMLFLCYLSILPITLELQLPRNCTPFELLIAYRNWCILVIILFVIMNVLVTAFRIPSFIQNIRFIFNKSTEASGNDLVTFKYVFLLVYLVTIVIWTLSYFFFKEEKPFDLYRLLQEDVRTVQNNGETEAYIYLSERHWDDGLFLYNNQFDAPLQHYRAIGHNADGTILESWDDFYIMKITEENIDTIHTFRESQSTEWNQENTTQYRITYTPNMHLILSLERLPVQSKERTQDQLQ